LGVDLNPIRGVPVLWFGMSLTRAGIIVALALALGIPARTSAQAPGAALRGFVEDQTHGRLPGVQLTLVHEATNERRETVTDGQGRFAFASLLAGRYLLEAQLTGFSIFRQIANVAVGRDLWTEVQLVVTTREVVTGAGEARIPLVERNSSAMRTLVDADQVANLPLDGRDFLQLALLAPGTAPAPERSASSVRGDFAFTTNGAREDFNHYLLDGVSNVDPKLNTPAVRPPVDAIQEFEVVASNYDASFGRNAGGQLNVITRSGSNRYTGTAYEFLRNGALDARNHFVPEGEPAPDYSRHQFGGSIGGPIARDRTFFFADYEGTRLREGLTRVTTVPTPEERAGDFSASPGGIPGNPFGGSQIPPAFIHPIGRAIVDLYPPPNRSGPAANFVSSPTLGDDIDQFDAKVEHLLPGGMRLAGRYSFSDRRLLEPFAGTGFATVPGFGNEVNRRGQNLVASLTHASPSMFYDLRVGYTRVSIGVVPENPQVDNASVGLATLATDPRDRGLSLISVGGYSPLGHEFNNPQATTSDTFQISDAVTWHRGAHLMKFGGDFWHTRQSGFRDVQARGFLTFVQQGITGNALADLLLGLPVLTGGARLDNPQNLRAHAWSVFAHDEWRVGPALSIAAGLRYDYMTPPVDADDRANLYDAATGTVIPVGTGGIPRGGHDPDRNNFGPRVGFAWAPDAERRQVIRSGYGVYYNQGALATSEGLYFNPPFFDLRVFFPVQGLPPLTLDDPFPASFPIPVPQSATAYQPDLQTPRMEHWNVSYQREITNRRAIEVAYVGSRGTHLTSARDLNQPAASPVVPNLRPNPRFADITLIESRASSRYHSLQVKYRQRIEDVLSALVSYTYGKSTDDASGFFTSAGDPNFPQNSLDPGAEESRSSFDARHRLSASVSWTLPFTGNVWLENWQVHAVATVETGRPFTVAMHPDIDASNTGRSNLGFGFNDRPDVTGDPALSSGDRSEDRWFDTSAFSPPAFGTFGNAGRNSLEGPGFSTVNLAVVRLIPAGPARLQLRLEVFNLLNRVNYDLPDGFLGSPTFGRILSAGAPRRVQFGVRVVF
jgi:hypothetical protein